MELSSLSVDRHETSHCLPVGHPPRTPHTATAYCGQSYINHTPALARRRSIYNEYIAKPEYNAIVGTGTRSRLRSAIDTANIDREDWRRVRQSECCRLDQAPRDNRSTTRRIGSGDLTDLQRKRPRSAALGGVSGDRAAAAATQCVCLSVDAVGRWCRGKFVDVLSVTR